jgi:hypothetical protein
MIGCIKAISPCVKSASAKLFLDLHTVSAPSGEERTLGAAAQLERTGRCCRRVDSGTHAWCGHATVMVLVPSASGPRVRGCPRAPLNFNPHPVREGGSYIGMGTVTCDQTLFSCGFLWHALLNRCRPDLGTLKTMCHRVRKRWDENTLLNK